MSTHGDGDKSPSKFFVKVTDEFELDHFVPKFTLKDDECVWVSTAWNMDTGTFRQVVRRRAVTRTRQALQADKAWNDAPKAIERLPAFGFRELVCRWVTSKFKDQVLDPLIADCDADFVEAVHKGDVAAQKRIKFKAHLWICHALFRGMISGVLGLFGRHRNSVE
ncbi:MAG: hypothetical protein PIQ35_27425 [Achromobacter xylosoxidans]